jgi:pimeloyl-ACP methyl ester carboxylesterase
MFTPAYRGGSGPPLVLLHGFTDTWRTWELVLPTLERRFEVFAPALAGHAGGPVLNGSLSAETLADGVEAALDDAGIGLARVAGNSLGGFVALELAARGRASSVVALAPAGGWDDGGRSLAETLDFFETMQRLVENAAPHAESIASTDSGRRRAMRYLTTRFDHLPADLVAHQIRGAAACDALPLPELARREGYELDAERITCPVRIVWGTEDAILSWPAAAERYRREWLPHADWVVLDGVGHCPQLDAPLETAQLIMGFP